MVGREAQIGAVQLPGGPGERSFEVVSCLERRPHHPERLANQSIPERPGFGFGVVLGERQRLLGQWPCRTMLGADEVMAP